MPATHAWTIPLGRDQLYCLAWQKVGCPCRHEDKAAALLWLLREVIPADSPTLVFAATRHHVEFLHTLLTREGLRSCCVYGQMDQVGALLGCLSTQLEQRSLPGPSLAAQPHAVKPRMRPKSTCRWALGTLGSGQSALFPK